MPSTEREGIEDYKISDENIHPNHWYIVDDKDYPSADALGKAKKLSKLGSKIFDRNSLKANQGSVLRETKLLGLSDRDIRELMNIREKDYTTSPVVRGKTAAKDRKQVTLSDVSKQLEKQSTQIEKVTQILQPLQKQTKLVQRQPESIKQMSSQINHIQEQISQIQKSIDKITRTQRSTATTKDTMEEIDSKTLQNSDRSTDLKIRYINSKSQREWFPFEESESTVLRMYNNL
ncbi:MAG: hypothetical protein ACREAS_07815, partial [Nitrososphaera sp.]